MLPDGRHAAPISADQKAALLRVCAVVERQAKGGGRALVVLRDTVDARVYLGCITDAEGGVVKWVELWVQNPEALAGSIALRRGQVTNALLDRRWQRTVRALERLAPGEMVHTGWESAPPPPAFIDVQSLEPVHPVEPSGEPWVLCRDDAALTAAGLPPYGASPHRYLHLVSASGGGAFVPVTPEAPASARTRSLREIVPSRPELVPLNPWSGQVLVRAFHPVGFEALVEALSSDLREGFNKAAAGADKSGAGAATLPNGHSRLFLAHQGQAGRLVEALHLKLRALADAVEEVHAAVRQLQLPLLNLSAESFRAELGPEGRALPSHWTARCRLVDPGDVVEWTLPGGDARYYLPARAGTLTVYRPPSGQPVLGRANVRVREVLPEGPGAIVLEGTFTTQERLDASKRDLVWFRMTAGGAPLNVYVRLEKTQALAAGEWRFRSVPFTQPPEVVASLKSEAGTQLSDLPFEHLPLLSTPCDLYSLGVLAVRALLVNAKTSLPVAFDELLSLARQVAVEHDKSVALGVRVARILSKDRRWVDSLGPQRLTNEPLSPQQAFELVPAELWCDVLGWVVRMFPGVGPDSRARDLGDAPPEGLQAVFLQPLEQLDDLLVRSRSLLAVDWKFNREVHLAIRQSLLRASAGAAAAGA